MNTRAIILCAGEATRWGNYLNTPKHLITIEGERLLDRTVRLLREQGVSDIHIVLKTPDSRYEVFGAQPYIATLNYEENADADKFLSSKSLWKEEGRTIVFYGDCYFTSAAISTILNNQREEWLLFCRPGRSKITGSQWGECFAQSFYPQHIKQHEESLHRVANLYKNGVIHRCGGWEHYRAMIDLPDDQIASSIMKDRYVEINDWTDDFDYPNDYDSWIKRRQVFRMKNGNDKINYFTILDLLFEQLLMTFKRVFKRQSRRISAYFRR